MGGGKGGKDKCVTIGYSYYMGLHIGVCRGPVDELVAIEAGGKVAWTGSIKDNASTYIDAPNLFGGRKKEGGLRGPLTILMGGGVQDIPPGLHHLYNPTHGTKGVLFKGAFTMYYHGLVSSMSPYIKPWKIRVRRTRAGWVNRPVELGDPEIFLKTPEGSQIQAMNPAHIIWEAMTNPQWGGGFPPHRLHIPSFAAAAETLRKEKFGLCLYWSRKTSVFEFVSSVQKYIEATLYVDRTDGKFHLDLLRECKDPDTLPLFTEKDGLLAVEEIGLPMEFGAVNEVTVKWHDPITDNDRVWREQNLAGFISSGQISSVSLSYPGLSTADLAARVAMRELRKRARSPRSFKLKLNRRAWNLQIGSLIRITTPLLELPSVPLRISRIEDGTLENSAMSVVATEDVYSATAAKMSSEQAQEFIQPDFTPKPPKQYCMLEVSYRDLVLVLDRANLQLVEPTEAWLQAAMTRPTALTLVSRFQHKPAGAESFPPCVQGGFSTWGKLLTTKPITGMTTEFELGEYNIGGEIKVGQVAIIMSESSHGKEVCEVVEVMDWTPEQRKLTVKRGLIDTIPQNWSKLSDKIEIWLLEKTLKAVQAYTVGTNLDTRFLTFTNQGESEPIDDTFRLIGRQGRPYPPANVKICDDYWTKTVDGTNENCVISWVHRDRKAQMDKLVDWFAGSIGPEDGTTYTLFIDDSVKGRIISETGLTEPNFTPDLSVLIAPRPQWNEPVPPPSNHELTLTLFSVRDGIESWQKFTHTFVYTAPSPEPLPKPPDPPSSGGSSTP